MGPAPGRVDNPQKRLTPMGWASSWLIAHTMRRPILWGGTAAGAALLAAALRLPWAVAAADLLLLAWYVTRVRQWRTSQRTVDPTRHLRAALVDIQGRDAEVHTAGRLPDGGPERLSIVPGEGWRHWRETAQAELAAAIAATMPGDWECILHRPDGVTAWQRLPELPERVDYPGPGEVTDWRAIPVGVDGYGRVVSLDFAAAPHWLLAGTTGAGKTSYLRVIGTHLLATKVQVVGLDPNRVGLSYLEGRPGVRCAIGEHTADGQYQAIAVELAGLVQKMGERLAELERTRKRPKPLVILVDEVEALLEDSKRNKGDVLADLMQLARQGRKVQIHLVLATQRPDATAMPTALRDLCAGRIAVGKLSEQAAKMMLGSDQEAGQRTTDTKGRAVLRGGSLLTAVQGYWMPDPADLDVSPRERAAAERWLPARETPQVTADVDAHVDADVDAPAPIESAPSAVSTRASGDARTRAGGRGRAERQRRYRANLRRDLAADPDDPRHGRPAGIQAGCTCRRCRPDIDTEAESA